MRVTDIIHSSSRDGKIRSVYTIAMNIQKNVSLAPYTSLRVGGEASEIYIANNYDSLIKAIESSPDKPNLFGFGCNILISDKGLPGRTIICRGGNVTVTENTLIVDAGVWWDDVVKTAIENNLWGLELMSEIPSSVGGAIFGNIAAYGQQISDTLVSFEAYDLDTRKIRTYNKNDFEFKYRWSSIQQHPELIITRATFELSKKPLHELRYDSALVIAEELGLDTETLEGRRKTIIETRGRAGSLYDPESDKYEHTAGSFFKNPLVSTEQAKELASFDETGKTLERIENQSRIHGGDSHRASAAHVLLAAGFNRGQTWDKVRLHPKHVLKIEAIDGATATEVYEVVQEILSTVKAKLDITLEPEVKFLGEF